MNSSSSPVHVRIFLLAIDGLCLENVFSRFTSTDTARHRHRHGRHRHVPSEVIRSQNTEKIETNPLHHKTHRHFLYVLLFSVWALRPYVRRILLSMLCHVPAAPNEWPPSRTQTHDRKPCFFSPSPLLHHINQRAIVPSTLWYLPFLSSYSM